MYGDHIAMIMDTALYGIFRNVSEKRILLSIGQADASQCYDRPRQENLLRTNFHSPRSGGKSLLIEFLLSFRRGA